MDFYMEVIQSFVVAYGVKLLSALLLLFIGKWLAEKITDMFAAILARQRVETTLVKFFRNISYYLLLILVIVAAAGQLGINTASFLTIIGAASLAVGLALKDSLANFASGLMLILFRPFRVGDVVTAAGETGTVEEITIFSTVLNTGDNQKKIIPNGAISNSTITNITANPIRRIDLVIAIGYDDDIRKAKETLMRIMKDEARILQDPAAIVAVSELADCSVNLVVRPWVKTEEYWNVYFKLLEDIKLTFDEEHITFPYPQRDIHLYAEEKVMQDVRG